MNIYFSGISGTGIGPLAELAKGAGYGVFGSDKLPGLILNELQENGIKPNIGEQTGEYLNHIHEPHHIDWFVYTSALPSNHPELVLAQKLGIKTSKRDDFLSYLIDEKNLNLIAVAGTHGKTTTTSMIVWALKQLDVCVSYIIGTTLDFAPSGNFTPESQYLVYECDEYDRNFLKYSPVLSLISSINYDHPDIYPTEQDYISAFRQFVEQSENTIAWQNQSEHLSDLPVTFLDLPNPRINLSGAHNRQNATLAIEAVQTILPDLAIDDIVAALNSFPGSKRRFERLAPNLYTDYAHHPDEIKATIQLAKEISPKVAVIYQPHQNTRQHQVFDLYPSAFEQADKILWLPTYLVREDDSLPVLEPQTFIDALHNPQIAQPADLNENLFIETKDLIDQGYLVILATAGPADEFFRSNVSRFN
jgi:UDP-N-acetylmuramate-alanine ligase